MADISEIPSSRARFAAHDTLRWKYPFAYETLKANTLQRDKDRSIRMQRIVDARSAAPGPPGPPGPSGPAARSTAAQAPAAAVLTRPVSMGRLEDTLRKQLRRSRSDLHPGCLLDGVKKEMCQRAMMTEVQFKAIAQKLLSEHLGDVLDLTRGPTLDR